MPTPLPHLMLPDVTHITPQLLQARGIAGLLIDIDGTLMQTRQPTPPQAVHDWIAQLRDSGIRCYILSNNKRQQRVQQLAENWDLPWRHLAGKPDPAPFLEAAEVLALPLAQIGVVGDQIFTDVWGARRCGMHALVVESLDSYLWYFPFRRLAELPFRKECAR